MSHSFTNLLYHIIFATKSREPLIDDALRPFLFGFLGEAISDEGGIALCVNGMAEHVHILAKLRPDRSVSEVIGTIKARSSGLIHRKRPDLANFFWQSGFGAFTVSQSQAPRVRRYIAGQEEHHCSVPFDREFRVLLRRNGFEVEESFFWE